MTRPRIEPVFQTIGEHSNHHTNGPILYKLYIYVRTRCDISDNSTDRQIDRQIDIAIYNKSNM